MCITRRFAHFAAITAVLWLWHNAVNPDPLPSWTDGSTKAAITDFVAKVTSRNSEHYIEPAARIAVFDSDGTLWPEQPVYFQLAFAADRLAALAPLHPQWHSTQPFKSLLEGDVAAVSAAGEHSVLKMMAATHTGITTDDFDTIAAVWLTTAEHPKLHRLYTQLAYQPMLELLAYLRVNGFKTFIVSGGGIEFIRTFAAQVYGIPPEQVIGSADVTRYEAGRSGPSLIKEAKVEFIDDGPGKPVAINRIIGRRPVLAFGNSDGDLQMLQWTAASTHLSLVALIHHTDARREFAYDRHSRVGRLDLALHEARSRHWLIVDMRTHWRTVFSPLP